MTVEEGDLASWRAERAETIRRRLRMNAIGLQLVFCVQVFFDHVVFPTVQVIAAYRLSELFINVATVIYLRKPRSHREVELATLVFAAWHWTTGAVGASVAIAPQELMMSVAYAAGALLFALALGCSARVTAVILTIVPVVFGVALASRGWSLTNLGIGALCMASCTAFALIGVHNRDRIDLAGHVAGRQLARANAALKAHEDARTRLFVNLSHDFRTPLAVIRAEAERLLAPHEASDRDDALRRIAANATSLGDLADQLLELARLDAARVPTDPLAVDVTALARDVAAQLRPTAARAHIEVNANDAVFAFADPRHVRRILQNLVGNALRAIGDADGRVEIALRDAGEEIEVQVVDDGPGISADRRAKLFQRFAFFDSRGSVASGVGLALARQLAENAGGTLDLVDAPSTTMRLVLPRASEPAIADRRSEPPIQLATTALAPSELDDRDAPAVLVVDDHADMRASLVRLLGRRFRVTEAADVPSAIARMRDGAFECVLCDVMLGEEDGYDLLAAIRATPSMAATPFVFLSARGEADQRARGLTAGADDYLGKPFSSEELLVRVERAITRAAGQNRALERLRDDVRMEIHDGVGASLGRAASLLDQDGPESRERARTAIGDGLAEARDLLNTVSRPEVAISELAASLRRVVADACELSDIVLDATVDADSSTILVPLAVEHALRRVVREGMTNVIRHSGARRVELAITARSGAIHVRIADDGRGLPEGAHGNGIGIMQRRIAMLGGHVDVRSSERGVVLEASVPLSLNRAASTDRAAPPALL